MNVHKRMFCIYDIKADTYGPPVIFSTKGEAMRWFEDLANEQNSPISRHSGDYQLFEIGSYDQASGKAVALESRISLGVASEFSKAARQGGSHQSSEFVEGLNGLRKAGGVA